MPKDKVIRIQQRSSVLMNKVDVNGMFWRGTLSTKPTLLGDHQR